MIFNQWYIILSSRELKTNKPQKIKRLNLTLAIWRNADGKVNCIDDRCCHRGASLSCGKIKDGDIECPFHGFRFNGKGRATLIPAIGKNGKIPEAMRVTHYPTHEAFGFIWLWWGNPDKATSSPFFFPDLNGFAYSEFKDDWPVHYSRAIENQLDVVHLPFVHKTTIGRGNKTIVNGPVVEREGDLMTFYVQNVEDNGKNVPLKADEMTNYKDLFFLKFHFPNLWQNYLSPQMRIVAAFVPVDEENTIIYIRTYQKFFRIPLLKELVGGLMNLSNLVILRQDKRVVVKQIPTKSSWGMDEVLIRGDKPIIEYRKYRQELIRQHNPEFEAREAE
jgi:phenylpropionate dioxygenase-like ring-hydroxylating dioxygenase large terminal subunit